MPRAKQPNPANNRTDLLTPAAPGRRMTTPDQEYGKRTAQEQSQKILPIGAPPVGSVAGGGGANPPTPGPPPAPTPAGLPNDPGPANTWMPSKPGAPFTTGMAEGPGPGPEALTGPAADMHAQINTAPNEQNTLKTVLTHLATQPQASSLIRALAGNA